MKVFIKKYLLNACIAMIALVALVFVRKILQPKKSPPPITIWIHGTGPVGVLPKSLAEFVHKLGKKMLYCKKGLHKAASLPKDYHHYKIADTLCTHAPDQFSFDWFYLFGWSGDLGHNVRKKEAYTLLAELKKIVALYKATYHCMPKIRIIAHSHGGNVALNLAQIQGKASMSVIIDELILLACPVQQITMRYIQHPMFKQVYALHSHFDTIQVLDPQGWPEYKNILEKTFKANSFSEALNTLKQLEEKPFFSERHFPNYKNVTQVRCQSKRRDLMHLEFILLPFVRQLPTTLQQLRTHNYTNDTKQDEVTINLQA